MRSRKNIGTPTMPAIISESPIALFACIVAPAPFAPCPSWQHHLPSAIFTNMYLAAIVIVLQIQIEPALHSQQLSFVSESEQAGRTEEVVETWYGRGNRRPLHEGQDHNQGLNCRER